MTLSTTGASQSITRPEWAARKERAGLPTPRRPSRLISACRGRGVSLGKSASTRPPPATGQYARKALQRLGRLLQTGGHLVCIRPRRRIESLGQRGQSLAPHRIGHALYDPLTRDRIPVSEKRHPLVRSGAVDDRRDGRTGGRAWGRAACGLSVWTGDTGAAAASSSSRRRA